jgi:hypothetical protein
MAVAVAVCILIQMTLASVVDQEVAAVLTLEHLLEVRHHHLDRAMLVVVVLAINPGMLELLGVEVAQVPRVPVVTMLRQFLATVELAFCGPTDTITLAVVVVEIGQQVSMPVMVA